MPFLEQMSSGMLQDTTLTNRRRAWRRLLSRRQKRLHICTVDELRHGLRHIIDVYRHNTDFNSKSNKVENRDAMRHYTQKPTPSVETLTHNSIHSVHELSEGKKQDAGKSTLVVATQN
jgi:hypothetical protein